MLKQKYIKERNKNSFTIETIFEYYKERGGKLNDINTFSQIFQANYTLNKDMLNEIDTYFNLTTLHSPPKDKNTVLGEFIKVIE